MNLLEYEAKSILAKAGVAVPRGQVIRPDDPVPTAPIVLKSQVHSGGRGKLGGVKVVSSGDTSAIAKEIFTLQIRGETPTVLLAEEIVRIAHEYYLSLTINRESAEIEVVAHQQGGIEVEAHQPEEFFRQSLTRESIDTVGQSLADYLDLESQLYKLQELLSHLLSCFIDQDGILLEINPLILTNDSQLVAGDCKMILDDDARFRHPEWKFEVAQANANFVTLDPKGTVATIANGAGLAMATVDAVTVAGMKPANFLDIGGGATVDSIVASFRRILEFPHVSAIVINIFGGIVRCDDVARAIIEAQKRCAELPTLYIRLSGTRSEEARMLLADARLDLYPDLETCLKELTDAA